VIEQLRRRIYNEGEMCDMVETPTREATRICLVRHGETEWNAERRIQGQIDIGLNATGRRQAAAAGRWLANAGIAALYSSDLARARTTAETIGQALGLAPVLAPELRERRYGTFEGLTYAEAEARFPQGYAAFAGRNADYDFENGESLRTMHARVTDKLINLATRHAGQAIVVVVHGGVLDIVNRFVRGNPLEMPRDFLIPNAGLNWIVAVDGRWRIESWGDTRHLEAEARDELPS
jgi:probable phosphoglycerate mutase